VSCIIAQTDNYAIGLLPGLNFTIILNDNAFLIIEGGDAISQINSY
jgi:hypothetical protein